MTVLLFLIYWNNYYTIYVHFVVHSILPCTLRTHDNDRTINHAYQAQARPGSGRREVCRPTGYCGPGIRSPGYEILMQGVNPHAYMQLVAEQIDSMSSRADIETALTELEYLFDVTDPEIQDHASDLIDRLRSRLNSIDAKS